MVLNLGDLGRFGFACLGAAIMTGIGHYNNRELGSVDVSMLIFVLYNNLLILNLRSKVENVH